MGARLEKHKERKKRKKIYILRIILIISIFIVFSGGLTIVDNSYRSIMNIKDKSLFQYNYYSDKHTLQLFGEEYTINQKTIENITVQGKVVLGSAKDFILNLYGQVKGYIIKIIG